MLHTCGSKRKQPTRLDYLRPLKKVNYCQTRQYIRKTTDLNQPLWNEFNTPSDNINNDKINWVGASSTKNYLIKDPILDWLKERKRNFSKFTNTKSTKRVIKGTPPTTTTSSSMLQNIFAMGNKFEFDIMQQIRQKYPDQVVSVIDNPYNTSIDKMADTLLYLKQGVPFIEQAPLYNTLNKTYGVADLLVRSDYINELFNHPTLYDQDEIYYPAPKLSGDYHYLVIDIKWSTIPLYTSQLHIKNTNLMPAYKGQLAIYTAALGQLQGYTPSKSYILSKGRSYTKSRKTHYNNDCFDKLSVIDYKEFDNLFLSKTHEAIEWVRNVRHNGDTWTHNPPSVDGLYPNMCNTYDNGYHTEKQKIADEIDELTTIWNVGYRHRENAHTNGVYKWSDPLCTAEVLGINSQYTGRVVDQIIKTNRGPKQILPTIIKNNESNWQTKKSNEFFIDFEMINNCFYYNDKGVCKTQHTCNTFVFMIGIGYIKNNKWHYKSLYTKDNSQKEEKRIFNEFAKIIPNNSSLYYWGHTEKSITTRLNKNNRHRYSTLLQQNNWVNLCDVFKREPITIKGAKKFGLKEISNAMYKNNMITTHWNDDINSGINAMFKAIKYYKYMNTNPPSNTDTHNTHLKHFNNIINYNEIDCKVLWDIITYLRKNNIHKVHKTPLRRSKRLHGQKN